MNYLDSWLCNANSSENVMYTDENSVTSLYMLLIFKEILLNDEWLLLKTFKSIPMTATYINILYVIPQVTLKLQVNMPFGFIHKNYKAFFQVGVSVHQTHEAVRQAAVETSQPNEAWSWYTTLVLTHHNQNRHKTWLQLSPMLTISRLPNS